MENEIQPGDLVAPVYDGANVYSFSESYDELSSSKIGEVKKSQVALVLRVGEGDNIDVVTLDGLHGWMLASLVKSV